MSRAGSPTATPHAYRAGRCRNLSELWQTLIDPLWRLWVLWAGGHKHTDKPPDREEEENFVLSSKELTPLGLKGSRGGADARRSRTADTEALCTGVAFQCEFPTTRIHGVTCQPILAKPVPT